MCVVMLSVNLRDLQFTIGCAVVVPIIMALDWTARTLQL